jgi:mannosylglycerate hydrolase
MDKYNLFVISHTHWDREWYQTFQEYRARLVYLMDNLIDLMEGNPEYRYFHMDGQTIVLEDYLEIRPENGDRLKKLVKDGRIIIGPWYVMPDEFLLSGESLVRNLQKGFDICAAYGVEPLECGYVTDIFGHNSQFPQILKGFGLDSALLYRGIGDYPRDAFTWSSMDGSSVLCIKMDRERSYSNFYFALRWPFEGRDFNKAEAVSRMKDLFSFSRDLAVSRNILMMDGVDHMEAEPGLPEILNVLNNEIPEINIRQSRLTDFIAEQKKTENLEEIKGELYELGKRGINNQVLKNVLSSMVHIKQMNNSCETLLTKWAEPFDLISNSINHKDTRGFFREAWKLLLQNHPHDSICGCSITRVHQDNEYRYRQVSDIANDILDRAMEDIALSADTRGKGTRCLVVFNPSQEEVDGVIEADIEFPEASQGSFRIYDNKGNEIEFQIISAAKSSVKRKVAFKRLIEFNRFDIYRVAFKAYIPPVGYSTYTYEEFNIIPPAKGDYTYQEFNCPVRHAGSLKTGHMAWENEYLKVSVSPSGSLDVVNRKTNKLYGNIPYFEDCGDAGDGWNYRKPSADKTYLSQGAEVSVEYDAPMAVQWKLVHKMTIPPGLSDSLAERLPASDEFAITTYITMRKESPILDFKSVIDNRSGEHRVRVLFPTYIDSDRFFASTPYWLQERSIIKPDRSNYIEKETGVFPNQGIVLIKDQKDSLALYNRGLYEIEVTEDKSHTLALTLFRSFRSEVGRDRGEMSFMFRTMTFEYALDFMPGENAVIKGEAWRAGIKGLCTDCHQGFLPSSKTFLQLDIKGAVLASFRKDEKGMAVLRLYNPSEKALSGTLGLPEEPKEVYLLNLNDENAGSISYTGNTIPLKLEKAQILSLGLKY